MPYGEKALHFNSTFTRIIIIVDPESEWDFPALRLGNIAIIVFIINSIFAVVVGNEPGAAEDGIERLVCCT